MEPALRRTHSNHESSVIFFYCSFDNATSQDHVNVLASFVAQLSKKTSVVRQLLQRSSTLNIDAPSGRYESTALQVSCIRSQTEIVRLLLDHGADPNSRAVSGTSCLFWAVAQGRTDIYRLLRPYGAKPDIVSEMDFLTEDPWNKAVLSRPYTKMEEEYQLEGRNRANESKRYRRE